MSLVSSSRQQYRDSNRGNVDVMTGGGGDGRSTTFKGITMHHPKRWHVVTGKGMCALMWFWILYRAKQDGPVVLGWRHPWEGHGDHSHDHGHEH